MAETLPEITVDEVDALVATGAFLLDVRENDEWAAGRAPQASHIPLGLLGDRARELPTDVTIRCMCKAGGRSARATTALREAGLDAVNVAGGMLAWAGAGLPLFDERGEPGSVI
jgi:rhodanese-related sulfurtransferase